MNKTIRIVPQPPFLGHQAAIYTLLVPETGKPLVWTAGSDGSIAEWQPLQTEHAVLRASVTEVVLSIAVAGNILAVGTMSGALHFIDLTTKTVVKSSILHQKGVFDIKIHDNFVFSIGGNGKLTRTALTDFYPIESLVLSDKNLRSFDFMHNICAVGSSDSNIYIVNTLYNGVNIDKIVQQTIKNAHEPSVFVVRFSPCGKYLISGGRDAMLKIWEIAADFALFHAIPAHLSTINDICYSPDGVYLATASRDKTIKIWSADGFQLLKVIDNFKNGGHFNSVNKLQWLDNRTLCSVSDDRTLRVFTIEILFLQ